MHFLYNGGNLLPDTPTVLDLPPPDSAISTELLQNFLNEGKLLARAIATPSGRKENLTEQDGEFEIRKIIRQPGTPTNTKKADRLQKHGFPYRSTSLLIPGAPVYASQGFLIFEPNVKQIYYYKGEDFNTGRGKKTDLVGTPAGVDADAFITFKKTLTVQGHNEILYHITIVDAVYYTQDHVLYDDIHNQGYSATHPYAPFLKAIYLQKKYKKMTGGCLPLIEYSHEYKNIRLVPIAEYTDEKIIDIWKRITRKSVTLKLRKQYGQFNLHTKEQLSDFKIEQVYGRKSARLNGFEDNIVCEPLDDCSDLDEQINNAILQEIEATKNDYQQDVQKRIQDNTLPLHSIEAVFAFMHFPALRKLFKNNVGEMLDEIELNGNIEQGLIFEKDPSSYKSFLKQISLLTSYDYQYFTHPFYEIPAIRLTILAHLFDQQRILTQVKNCVNKVLFDLSKKSPKKDWFFLDCCIRTLESLVAISLFLRCINKQEDYAEQINNQIDDLLDVFKEHLHLDHFPYRKIYIFLYELKQGGFLTLGRVEKFKNLNKTYMNDTLRAGLEDPFGLPVTSDYDDFRNVQNRALEARNFLLEIIQDSTNRNESTENIDLAEITDTLEKKQNESDNSTQPFVDIPKTESIGFNISPHESSAENESPEAPFGLPVTSIHNEDTRSVDSDLDKKAPNPISPSKSSFFNSFRNPALPIVGSLVMAASVSIGGLAVAGLLSTAFFTAGFAVPLLGIAISLLVIGSNLWIAHSLSQIPMQDGSNFLSI